MSSIAHKHNVGLDLSGKVAVVSGGTQGIGAATARRFAQAGSSVYIVGRNVALGNNVVDDLKASFGGEEKTFEFIRADLSLVSDVKDVAAKLHEKTGIHGINFLVETQGNTPNGLPSLTSEGHEMHFAVQVLSRFGLAYLLAKSNTLKESVVIVCAPYGATGQPPPLEDLELFKSQNLGRLQFMVASGNRDANTLDGVIAQFPKTFPRLKAFHVYPGLVTTSLFANSGFPYFIVVLIRLLGPLIERTFGNSPASYAEVPVFLTANPKAEGMGQYLNEKLKSLGYPTWTTEQPEIRQALWDKMISLGDF